MKLVVIIIILLFIIIILKIVLTYILPATEFHGPFSTYFGDIFLSVLVAWLNLTVFISCDENFDYSKQMFLLILDLVG